MKLKIQIKSIYGAVLFEFEKENNTIKDTILEAIKTNSDLRGSNLSGSDLRGSNLSGSDLRGSNLRGSDLRGSNLSGSNLRGSNLSNSDLSGSDLSGSDLSNSDLSGSNLRGSDLSNSDLSGSNLRGSDLRVFKNDLWEILLRTKNEILGLKQKINQGKIDGSVYEGECCCLVGTIATIRNCDYRSIQGVYPSASRPAEQWFSQFKQHMTPENNSNLKLTIEWIEEFEMLLN